MATIKPLNVKQTYKLLLVQVKVKKKLYWRKLCFQHEMRRDSKENKAICGDTSELLSILSPSLL